MTQYNTIETKAVASLAYMGYLNYADYRRCIIDKSYLQEFIKLPFEGYDFVVPKNYHEILNVQYGNYMRIPTLSEREDHSLIFKG